MIKLAKKFTSLVLLVCFSIWVFPMSASASSIDVGNQNQSVKSSVYSVSDTDSLDQALADIASSGVTEATIELTNAVTLSSQEFGVPNVHLNVVSAPLGGGSPKDKCTHWNK